MPYRSACNLSIVARILLSLGRSRARAHTHTVSARYIYALTQGFFSLLFDFVAEFHPLFCYKSQHAVSKLNIDTNQKTIRCGVTRLGECKTSLYVVDQLVNTRNCNAGDDSVHNVQHLLQCHETSFTARAAMQRRRSPIDILTFSRLTSNINFRSYVCLLVGLYSVALFVKRR